MSLRSTCVGVQTSLAVALCGLRRCCGAEEALGVIRLLCSDTRHVRLCRLGPASPRWTFWSLPGGEGGRLQGLTHGPGSRLAPGGRGKLVFLCHAPCVTLSMEWLARPCLERGVREPPSPNGSGLIFLYLGLGWCRKPGKSQGPS